MAGSSGTVPLEHPRTRTFINRPQWLLCAPQLCACPRTSELLVSGGDVSLRPPKRITNQANCECGLLGSCVQRGEKERSQKRAGERRAANTKRRDRKGLTSTGVSQVAPRISCPALDLPAPRGPRHKESPCRRAARPLQMVQAGHMSKMTAKPDTAPMRASQQFVGRRP